MTDQIRNNDLNEWVMAWEMILVIKMQNSDGTFKVLLLTSHLTSNWFQNKQKIGFSLINDFILKIGMGNSIRVITCSLRVVVSMGSYTNSRNLWNKPASTNTLWKWEFKRLVWRIIPEGGCTFYQLHMKTQYVFPLCPGIYCKLVLFTLMRSLPEP